MAIWDQVIYVTRVAPSKRDTRGMGLPSQPDNPANFGELPAIVVRDLASNRKALCVLGVPNNFLVERSEPFDALAPKWGTWKPLT